MNPDPDQGFANPGFPRGQPAWGGGLVTRTYHLDGINPDGSGLAALAAGEGARGIIRW